MRLFTWFLAFLMFFQSTSLGIQDILKINELIEHAQFHNEAYGDSLFVFISKHYGELKQGHMEHNHDEEEDHEKLPFNHTSCQHINFQVIVMAPFDIAFGKPLPKKDSQSYPFYQEPSSSQYLQGIFQPPKPA